MRIRSETGSHRLLLLLVLVAAAAAAPAVSAQGPTVKFKPMGLGFGPWIDGQNPELGAVVGEAQVRERLALIAPYTRWIRVFGSTHGLEHVAPVAREFGLQVACGAWLDSDPSANAEEIAAVVLAASQGHCDLIVVGSEVLQRGTLTEAQLVGYIDTVQAAVTVVPVTTAEVYSRLLAHPAVIAAVDLLLVHYYPAWEGVLLKHAVASVYRNHARMVAAARGKPVWIGETGWPSCGPKNGDAVANVKNAAKYFLNVVSWVRADDVPLFYFEALDESWKTVREGPWGACWGVFDKHGVMKPGMKKVFDGKRAADHWSGRRVVGGAGTPAITLTSVPRYGSQKDLKGKVRHVAPAHYRVAVLIRVAGLWWTKPTFAAPATEIWPDGTWVCDITTGGADPQATDIAAFLLPAAFAPPLVSGSPVVPAALEQNAVASATVIRTP